MKSSFVEKFSRFCFVISEGLINFAPQRAQHWVPACKTAGILFCSHQEKVKPNKNIKINTQWLICHKKGSTN